VIVGRARDNLAQLVNSVMFREADVTRDPKERYCDGGGCYGVEKYVDALSTRVV